MLAFDSHRGRVAPLDANDVDTDRIIPKQYLLRVVREGFGQTLFDDERYLDPGRPDSDHSRRRANPDFFLNQPRYADSTILLTRANFGCGSSREHAVWALMQYGFRVIIAENFSDIFAGNAFKNGLLLVELPAEQITRLFAIEAASEQTLMLNVDLREQSVARVGPDTEKARFNSSFVIDAGHRRNLLAGMDDISSSLCYLDEIKAFERAYLNKHPWLNKADRR